MQNVHRLASRIIDNYKHWPTIFFYQPSITIFSPWLVGDQLAKLHAGIHGYMQDARRKSDNH